MKHKSTILLLLAMILAWGFHSPINKIGLVYTSPSNYIELRLFISMLTMFIIAFTTKNLILPNRKDIPLILMIGFFQIGLTLNLGTHGLAILGAGKSTFLLFTVSIWIIPLKALFHKNIGFLEGFSLSLGIFGIFLLIEPWAPSHIVDKFQGEIFSLLAAFSWAIGIFGARHMTWHRPALQLLPWQFLLASICTIVVASSRGIRIIPPSTNPIFIYSLLYTGIISTAFCYYAMSIISKHLPPSITSFSLLLVPIIALNISHFFLQEHVSLGFLCGVLLLLLGVGVHIYAEKKEINPT